MSIRSRDCVFFIVGGCCGVALCALFYLSKTVPSEAAPRWVSRRSALELVIPTPAMEITFPMADTDLEWHDDYLWVGLQDSRSLTMDQTNSRRSVPGVFVSRDGNVIFGGYTEWISSRYPLLPPHFENGYAVIELREGKERDVVIDSIGKVVYMAPDGYSIIAFDGSTVELQSENEWSKRVKIDLDKDASTSSEPPANP